MKRYLTQEDIRAVRSAGLKSADSIAMTMKICGHNSVLEPFLWEAFNAGYEAGKMHAKRVREDKQSRPKRTNVTSSKSCNE